MTQFEGELILSGCQGRPRQGAAETPDSDALVIRAQSGQVKAFERFLERHEALVLRTALRMLGNREDALDAAQQIVEDGLRTLPERERAAITLRDIEGLSTGEVASIMNVGESTVRSLISKARKVQRHVERCVTCQTVETEFREGQTTLHTLRESSIDESLRGALHSRVLGAIPRSHKPGPEDADLASDAPRTHRMRQDRRRMVHVTVYAGLAISIVSIAVIGLTLHEPDPPINAPAQTAMVPPDVQLPMESIDTSSSGSQISDPQIVNSIDGEPLRSTVVRMYTNDPRVVFFLVSDQTGG